ncbi:MAG: ATP-binding protein [Novosphingobium sp.]|uniref:AAA family ATPase n=1 Tax=Novosphingobium sp. TaxID=1874826 RepID=UPI0022C2E4A6|nr:ATP-binding protein [Novosphingobium sp.]MCZ8036313.1 ATP-binding protein [Novosphingobium sp.]
MARSDLLISLVKASVNGDKSAVRSAVENIIAEEKGKQHNVLAERLSRALQTNGSGSRTLPSTSYDGQMRAREALAEVTPKRQLETLTLTEKTRQSINQLIEEQQRASLLRAHGLDPRHRVMLVGPPGNGKTSLAEAIAEALAVPFFIIRYEALIGSYLGETAQRLKRVFDFIRTTPCVVFFDEFDAVGKERGDLHETGEIKRVVSSLLMHVDELPSYAVIIAASNHAELLDRAVWRRFQVRLNLPAPTPKELQSYLDQHFKNFDDSPGMSIANVVKRLGHISYAEAEEFVLDIRRRHILSMKETPLRTLLNAQLEAWEERAKPRYQASKAAD